MSKLNSKASVGCLVRHGDKLIVVYEEQDGTGAWDIPAGGIEAGETPAAALLRELHEEIGLEISSCPRLIRIYWATLNDVPTVHFLYEFDITDEQAAKLQPHTTDIQKIAGFSRSQIQKLIDSEAYEHELARARLQLCLDGGSSGDVQFVAL